MRFFILIICLAACLPTTLVAQIPPASAAPDLPHIVGLIDMAYVFKNSQKFLTLTEGLQHEIEKTDREAKQIVDRVRLLQTQLTSGDLQPGSPESAKIEDQIVKAKTELETFKRVAQQSFLRKEAEIYKQVYLEVEDAVRRYATYYKMTLVLRFDRNAMADTDDPREVMNGMNRQVVHYRLEDDLTEPILKFLNSEWEKQGGAKPVSQSKSSEAIQFYSGPITR